MYRIAVCEDEKYILEELHQKVEKYIKQKQLTADVKTYMSGEDLLKEKNTYDIVLLDMMLPGISGIEVAKQLYRKSRIIFITFYEKYALDAFEVDAVHYLIKPVSDERLYLALDRAIGRLEQIDHKMLTLVKAGKTRIIDIHDILYCEVFNHQVIIHTMQDAYDYPGSLDMLENELDGGFFRCHRSYIINMKYVIGREEGTAIISRGDRILVSRRKQTELQIVSIGFYIWWLFINGWLYTAEFSFIQSFTGIQGKKYMIPYVLLSDTLTFLMMYCNSAGVPRLILHMGLIVCFCRFLLNLKWIAAIAPTMIVLTLSTFMEGFQTISMRWLVKQNVGECIGIVIQMLVSGTLAILLVITLQFVAKKYAYTGQQKISSYLYALLLPCVFIVWVVRSGLGLDMRMNQSFKDQSDLWALIWILGACAIFFIILKLVSKIITLSKEETEQKRLQDQIKRQYIYLEEAKKRNEQYRMFQHDINNQFLVLSGLIREKNYNKAKEYFDKLHKTSDKLLIGIESGNPVIDILLNEKVNFAKLNGIEVKHDIKNLADCSVEDMDLCIILANAIDNAIQACIKEKNVHPEIVIAMRRRHHFLIAEVTNTMLPENYTFEYGTGLENIKHIVEKYEGTMEIETSENCFRLSILLCLLPFANME